MKVVILGNGAFGKAMYSVISQNEQDVTFWRRGTPITEADALVLAVPTQAIRDVLNNVHTEKMPVIINCSKGIEQGTHALPYQIVQEVLGKDVQYFSLMGPSFSKEIIDELPTLVNLGYMPHSVPVAVQQRIKSLFLTSYFRLRLTECVREIEIAGAFKNIYAVGAGIAAGLGFGMNTRANLIALAVDETFILCEKLGFTIDPHAMPAIIGDIVLTCSSTDSRNFRFGMLLVEHPVPKALELIDAAVEGYNAALSVEYFLTKTNGETPLAQLVSEILHKQDKGALRDRFMRFFKQV